MRRRNDGAGGSLREEFGDVCFHALGIIDQNREYLQMHLLASADLPTRQALSDIQIESARLDRTVRNADRKSTRLNSSHDRQSRMPSSA